MLSGLDPHSQTWLAVKEWAQKQIEERRNQLEEKDDEQVRGRIKALRDLLDLGAEKPRPVVAPRAARPDQR